jgi:hypothetical protein
MARFLLESNKKFCAIFRRQVQKNTQETAGRLFIEGGVVVITNEKSASVRRSADRWVEAISNGETNAQRGMRNEVPAIR